MRQCRALLGADAVESDSDIERLRDELYEVARVWIDGAMTMFEVPSAEPPAVLTEDDRIEVEERAAVLEFEGGLSRVEAERAALTGHMRQRRSVHR